MATRKVDEKSKVTNAVKPLEYITQCLPKDKNDAGFTPRLGVTQPGSWAAGHYSKKVDDYKLKIEDELKIKVEKAEAEGKKFNRKADYKPEYSRVALLVKSIVTLEQGYAPALAPIVKQMILETIAAVEVGEYIPLNKEGEIQDQLLVSRFVSRAKSLLHADDYTICMKGVYFVYGWVDDNDAE